MKPARTAIVTAALLLGACSGMQAGNMKMAALGGAIVGGVAGGWAGSHIGGGTGETLMTVLGAATGAMVGYELGRQIDLADRSDYGQAVASALDDGNGQALWNNPSTGNGGLIRADQAFLNSSGKECKTYRSTVTFKDEILSGSGTACRGNSDQWVLVADAFH